MKKHVAAFLFAVAMIAMQTAAAEDKIADVTDMWTLMLPNWRRAESG